VFAIGKSQQVTYMKQVDVAKMCNAMVPMNDPFSEIIVMNIIVICKLINMSSCYCTIPV
jgi:hypothetical protein